MDIYFFYYYYYSFRKKKKINFYINSFSSQKEGVQREYCLLTAGGMVIPTDMIINQHSMYTINSRFVEIIGLNYEISYYRDADFQGCPSQVQSPRSGVLNLGGTETQTNKYTGLPKLGLPKYELIGWMGGSYSLYIVILVYILLRIYKGENHSFIDNVYSYWNLGINQHTRLYMI